MQTDTPGDKHPEVTKSQPLRGFTIYLRYRFSIVRPFKLGLHFVTAMSLPFCSIGHSSEAPLQVTAADDDISHSLARPYMSAPPVYSDLSKNLPREIV